MHPNSYGFDIKQGISVKTLTCAFWIVFISYYLQCFLRGLEHVCLLMRRNIKNKPSNSSVLLLAPDFYTFSKTHPLPEQKSSQKPDAGLIRQSDRESARSPLFYESSIQNEPKPITCLREEDRKMIATDALDLAAAEKNIYGSVSYSGPTPSIYSKQNEISPHHTLSDSTLPEKTISNNKPYIVTSISCQERNEILLDHPSSPPKTQNNNVQANDIISSSDNSQSSHQHILMATNRYLQPLVQRLPGGDDILQHDICEAYSTLALRYYAEGMTSSFQPIYPRFTGPVVLRQAVGCESYSNGKSDETSTHSTSLYQHFNRRQHEHPITNTGFTLATPIPVMSIPSMYQDNALSNDLYSSVNTPLTLLQLTQCNKIQVLLFTRPVTTCLWAVLHDE